MKNLSKSLQLSLGFDDPGPEVRPIPTEPTIGATGSADTAIPDAPVVRRPPTLREDYEMCLLQLKRDLAVINGDPAYWGPPPGVDLYKERVEWFQERAAELHDQLLIEEDHGLV